MASGSANAAEHRILNDSRMRNAISQKAAQKSAQRRVNPVARFAPAPRVTSSSNGRYSAPSAPPASGPGPVPQVSIDDFLNQDTGYQQQLRELANALSQFGADTTRRKGDYETQYNTSKKALADQRVKDLDLLEDDYGARGILKSGLYAKGVSDYETEYSNRVTDLDTSQKQALAALEAEIGRYNSQQELQKQAAKESAIRRRAEKYGI